MFMKGELNEKAPRLDATGLKNENNSKGNFYIPRN